MGTNRVVSDEIYCLLGGDVCHWIDLCKAGQVGDLESDEYVGTILTDNLIVNVCVRERERDHYVLYVMVCNILTCMFPICSGLRPV